MSQRFPPEVHTFIRENVVGRTAEELAAMTNAAFGTNFTKATMKGYWSNHKLRSGTPRGRTKGQPSKTFPAPVHDFIMANYHGTGHAQMAAMLKENFGMVYTPSQIKGFYGNHKLNSGLTGRFEKGSTPFNKGRKGVCAPGCEKTHFQKGHTPANKLPIGTILTKADGYLWQKIGEGCREWKQLHIIRWEEAHGPIPEGCVVIFKDGDRQNCDLENLTMVTRGELAVMNKLGLRSADPAYMDTSILVAQVKIAANKRKKRTADHE